MSCKGICTRHISPKTFFSTRYAKGQKRCKTCDIFIKWDGIHCPCCGFKLRVKPRTSMGKEKLLARLKLE